MKTKFAVILKIKKDILSRIERELTNINNTILAKENEIENLKIELRNIKIPQVSVYMDFLRYKNHLSAFENEILQQTHLLELMKSSKIDINKRYKVALIEYEKINFLHLQEVKERQKALNQIEQKMLDDISGIMYHRHSKSVE